MTPYNTLRLFVTSLLIVLSSIDTPAAFTLRRTTGGPRDLAQENGFLQVIDINRSNDNRSNKIKRTTANVEAISTFNTSSGEENTSQRHYGDLKRINQRSNVIATQNRNDHLTTERQDPTATTTHHKDVSLESTTDSENLDQASFETVLLATVTEPLEHISSEYSTTTDAINQLSTKEYTADKPLTYETTDDLLSTTEAIPKSTGVMEKPQTTVLLKAQKIPSWKKYKTIQRKRLPTASEEKKSKTKAEEMIKAESKRSRVSLKDTVTSDIPSLDRLKNDLLLSTKETQGSREGVTESLSTEFSTNSPTTSDVSSTKWDRVESKRAGYLDLSDKTTHTLQTPNSSFGLNIPTERFRALFDSDSETDLPEEQFGSKIESQSQLNEDAIKEELLKEEIIMDNKENFKRTDDKFETSAETESSKQQQSNSSLAEKLSVKPISSEKSINSSLYTVSPNYKPLKKIEVKPPKPFVRDPDDNSWRNESLSSLGIVFNPKNSSKPFTQVLKNKTETEWNNYVEKDSKNDIPDLRERLQKMAEKRKSKRKKTDSFGNVYFDYEESSQSVEQTTSNEIPTNVTSTTELSTSISAIEKPQNSSITPTTEKADTGGDPYTTRKYRKFVFPNIHEYYDTTDEDDTDYLNLAKIDIKKFTTSKKNTPSQPTTTPVTQPTLPWPFSRPAHTNPPGRKATIQYFPPLTTQKVNINDYDSDFKYKVDSFTERESPKNVPAHEPTPLNIVEYKERNKEKLREQAAVTNKPDPNTNLYLTQPPHTTQAEFPILNDENAFDRDTYVIRNYKDFINNAARDSTFNRHLDYIPFTDPPARGLTKAEAYETEKPKANEEELDYDAEFRKDVLQRFVDNFNRNSDRFKSHFPVLFNSSIVHRDSVNGDVAASRAFMRGLYSGVRGKPAKPACEPNCENITVELSPSYELHYYVPEQEEKEEIISPPATLPYAYGL